MMYFMYTLHHAIHIQQLADIFIACKIRTKRGVLFVQQAFRNSEAQ